MPRFPGDFSREYSSGGITIRERLAAASVLSSVTNTQTSAVGSGFSDTLVNTGLTLEQLAWLEAKSTDENDLLSVLIQSGQGSGTAFMADPGDIGVTEPIGTKDTLPATDPEKVDIPAPPELPPSFPPEPATGGWGNLLGGIEGLAEDAFSVMFPAVYGVVQEALGQEPVVGAGFGGDYAGNSNQGLRSLINDMWQDDRSRNR